MRLNLKHKLAALAVVFAAGGSALGIGLNQGTAHLAVAAVSPPTIILSHGAGSPVVGDTLTTTNGTWSHTAPTSYDYQWQNCNSGGGSCAAIGGATCTNGGTGCPYTIIDNVGGTIKVAVTAHNPYGQATQTSAPTATISSSGGTGIALGVPHSVCTVGGVTNGMTATCTQAPISSSITSGSQLPSCTTTTTSTCQATISTGWQVGGTPYPNCTTNCSSEGFQIGIPPNLDVQDSNNKVPVFIVFPDACTRPTGCFNTATDNGPNGWNAWAATDKLMIVDMFPDGAAWGNPGQFSYPTVYNVPKTCGSGTCSDAPVLAGIIAYLKSHYQIDPNWIVAGGGSKGGSMSIEALCDSVTEPLLSGIFISSAFMPSTGSTPSNGVPGNAGGSCPSLLAQPEIATSGRYAPSSNPHPIVILHQSSWMDSTSNTSTNKNCDASSVGWSDLPPYVGQVPTGLTPTAWGCFAGGLGASGFWRFLPPDLLRRVYGPALGCSTTPISTALGTSTRGNGNATDWPNPASVVGGTPRQIQQTYQCTGNIRIALWAMGNLAFGSGCHAYSCPVPNTTAPNGTAYEQQAVFKYFEFGSPTTDGSTTSSTN